LSSGDIRTFSSDVRLRPVDMATGLYIIMEIILLLIFMIGRPGWQYLLFFYMAALGVVALMVLLNFEEAAPFWRIIRIIYPLFLFTLFYEAVGPQIFMIFDNPFDSHVVGLEKMIFGVDPAFAIQPHIEVWLNELMSFAYFSYYLMLPGVAIILLVKRRFGSLERMVLAAAVTFYVCYLIFIFYPVVGPRFHLADYYYLPLIGPFFTPLMQRILAAGGLFGGAMPSSHCAVALVALWTLAREVRKAAVPAMLLLALLCVGTIYGRCHYVSDVVAGLLLGTAVLWITKFWQGRFFAVQRESNGDFLVGASVSGQEQPATINTRKDSF
jgi:membrane-associated phospholipid phosphatase